MDTKEAVQNILEESIKDIVIDGIKKVDIQGIFNTQIESVVKEVARDMFSSYGDFSKSLNEKLKNEIEFNINSVNLPQFGAIATEIVKSNLQGIEKAHKEELEKKIKKEIDIFLGVTKEPATTNKLLELFYENAYEESKYDNCSCDEEPRDLDDFMQYFEYNSNRTFEFTLHERDTDYHFETGGCVTHLNLFTEKDGDKYGISLHINRRKDEERDDKSISDDKWRKTSNNLYSIITMEVNGKYLTREGVIVYNDLNNDLEKLLVGIYQNNALLDLSNLDGVEMEEE